MLMCVSRYIYVDMRMFVCGWLCEGDGEDLILWRQFLYYITVIKNIKRLVVSGGFGVTATLASTEVICEFIILIQPLTSLIIVYPCHSLNYKVMLQRLDQCEFSC